MSDKITITGHDIRRGGEKIGWIDVHKIRSHSDNKVLGYFDTEHIYSPEGHHLGYVSGDHLYSADGRVKVALEEVSEHIEGGLDEGLEKCAVYMLLGD